METLLDMPGYRARIGGRQEVMVGYSDSAKDVGRFGAAGHQLASHFGLASQARHSKSSISKGLLPLPLPLLLPLSDVLSELRATRWRHQSRWCLPLWW